MKTFLPISLGLLALFLALALTGALFWSLPLPVILKVTVLDPGGEPLAGEPLANVPVNIFIEDGVWTVYDFDTSTGANGCFGLISHRAWAPSAVLSFTKVETLSFDIEKENDRLFEGLFRAEVADLEVG